MNNGYYACSFLKIRCLFDLYENIVVLEDFNPMKKFHVKTHILSFNILIEWVIIDCREKLARGPTS